jgi:hypothetical protein
LIEDNVILGELLKYNICDEFDKFDSVHPAEVVPEEPG